MKRVGGAKRRSGSGEDPEKERPPVDPGSSSLSSYDGLVKNPSIPLGAGLRFNFAPLDNNPAAGIQREPPIFEAEKPFEKYLTG
jgi:hypothetical protein